MKRRSFAAMVATAAWCLAACSNDVRESDADGSGGSGGAAEAASTATSGSGGAPSSTGGNTSTVNVSAGDTSSTTGTGPECSEPTFSDPALEACGDDNCCEEKTACNASGCLVGDTDVIDSSLPDGGALYECMYFANCFGGAPVCDSGIVFGDDTPTIDELEFAYCLDQNCCEEMTACTDGGVEIDACRECLEGNGPADLCAAVNECFEDNCGSGPDIDLCDSGIGFGPLENRTCAEDNCCDAFNACSNSGESNESIQACIDCFEAGGGPLCDAAIACYDELCDPSICDSGIAINGDIELVHCLSDNCCAEYTACTGGDPEDQDAVQACIDCFVDEGGPLCDAAIACGNDLCAGDPG